MALYRSKIRSQVRKTYSLPVRRPARDALPEVRVKTLPEPLLEPLPSPLLHQPVQPLTLNSSVTRSHASFETTSKVAQKGRLSRALEKRAVPRVVRPKRSADALTPRITDSKSPRQRKSVSPSRKVPRKRHEKRSAGKREQQESSGGKESSSTSSSTDTKKEDRKKRKSRDKSKSSKRIQSALNALETIKQAASQPVRESRYVGSMHTFSLSASLQLLEFMCARYNQRNSIVKEEQCKGKALTEQQYEEERLLRVSVATNASKIEQLEREIALAKQLKENEATHKAAVCLAYNREVDACMKDCVKQRRLLSALGKLCINLQSDVVELPEDFLKRSLLEDQESSDSSSDLGYSSSSGSASASAGSAQESVSSVGSETKVRSKSRKPKLSSRRPNRKKRARKSSSSSSAPPKKNAPKPTKSVASENPKIAVPEKTSMKTSGLQTKDMDVKTLAAESVVQSLQLGEWHPALWNAGAVDATFNFKTLDMSEASSGEVEFGHSENSVFLRWMQEAKTVCNPDDLKHYLRRRLEHDSDLLWDQAGNDEDEKANVTTAGGSSTKGDRDSPCAPNEASLGLVSPLILSSLKHFQSTAAEAPTGIEPDTQKLQNAERVEGQISDLDADVSGNEYAESSFPSSASVHCYIIHSGRQEKGTRLSKRQTPGVPVLSLADAPPPKYFVTEQCGDMTDEERRQIGSLLNSPSAAEFRAACKLHSVLADIGHSRGQGDSEIRETRLETDPKAIQPVADVPPTMVDPKDPNEESTVDLPRPAISQTVCNKQCDEEESPRKRRSLRQIDDCRSNPPSAHRQTSHSSITSEISSSVVQVSQVHQRQSQYKPPVPSLNLAYVRPHRYIHKERHNSDGTVSTPSVKKKSAKGKQTPQEFLKSLEAKTAQINSASLHSSATPSRWQLSISRSPSLSVSASNPIASPSALSFSSISASKQFEDAIESSRSFHQKNATERDIAKDFSELHRQLQASFSSGVPLRRRSRESLSVGANVSAVEMLPSKDTFYKGVPAFSEKLKSEINLEMHKLQEQFESAQDRMMDAIQSDLDASKGQTSSSSATSESPRCDNSARDSTSQTLLDAIRSLPLDQLPPEILQYLHSALLSAFPSKASRISEPKISESRIDEYGIEEPRVDEPKIDEIQDPRSNTCTSPRTISDITETPNQMFIPRRTSRLQKTTVPSIRDRNRAHQESMYPDASLLGHLGPQRSTIGHPPLDNNRCNEHPFTVPLITRSTSPRIATTKHVRPSISKALLAAPSTAPKRPCLSPSAMKRTTASFQRKEKENNLRNRLQNAPESGSHKFFSSTPTSLPHTFPAVQRQTPLTATVQRSTQTREFATTTSGSQAPALSNSCSSNTLNHSLSASADSCATTPPHFNNRAPDWTSRRYVQSRIGKTIVNQYDHREKTINRSLSPIRSPPLGLQQSQAMDRGASLDRLDQARYARHTTASMAKSIFHQSPSTSQFGRNTAETYTAGRSAAPSQRTLVLRPFNSQTLNNGVKAFERPSQRVWLTPNRSPFQLVEKNSLIYSRSHSTGTISPQNSKDTKTAIPKMPTRSTLLRDKRSTGFVDGEVITLRTNPILPARGVVFDPTQPRAGLSRIQSSNFQRQQFTSTNSVRIRTNAISRLQESSANANLRIPSCAPFSSAFAAPHYNLKGFAAYKWNLNLKWPLLGGTKPSKTPIDRIPVDDFCNQIAYGN
eukprot:Gregarina_sp_Poly_1__10890@NODE_84_length_15393_cov_100_561529_g72_i0_p1_GENE_NODE_84_length_15393_cov_100_561529_g72_i0NODE_84_length_15393_cov_100_561529_g72_i0_p1_ORF_typecomplete_len1695_score223_09_NODE_84_length_15393_cov_100_561529_g72_i0808613170